MLYQLSYYRIRYNKGSKKNQDNSDYLKNFNNFIEILLTGKLYYTAT